MLDWGFGLYIFFCRIKPNKNKEKKAKEFWNWNK